MRKTPLATLCVLVATTLAGSASPSPSTGEGAVDAAVTRLLPRIVQARRTIHANPELGEREQQTAEYIAAWLSELGLEVRRGVGLTGVVGVLTGGRPGGVVAYRADMDALPIAERTGLPYASTKTDTWDGAEVGVMHACGHDVHMAVALGVAAVLADPAVRAELAGTVLFVFQPAEEGLPGGGVHGAERMLAEGVFDDPRPSAVFGMHVNPRLALGQVALVPGGAMAAVDRFDIQVVGRQTHGAYPQAGIDPIVVASHIVVALQTIPSRNVDTMDAVVLSVGKVAAGNRFNVIPETAALLGTIRTHDEAVQERVHERMRVLVEATAEAFGATAELTIQKITPVTVNDPRLVERMRPSLVAAVGVDGLVAERPHMGGEDFAFFAREVPGLYYFLGVADPDKGPAAMIHTPEFSPHEGALEVGVRASTRLLFDYLEPAGGR